MEFTEIILHYRFITQYQSTDFYQSIEWNILVYSNYLNSIVIKNTYLIKLSSDTISSSIKIVLNKPLSLKL